MVPILRSQSRPASATVEAAIVFPIMLTLLLTLIVGGIGVFRYQQVALLGQEASRWASVRGADYHKDTNQTCPTEDQICQQAVLPMAVGMDASQLTVQTQWVNQGNATVQDWDAAPKDVKSLTASGEYVTNTVRVTITYNWIPGILVGPWTLTSVSETPMSE